MATVDDGIQNLRGFIGHLISANGALETVTAHLEGATRDVSQLEQEATEHGGGLNDDLTEFATQLAAARAEAVKAMEDLAQDAGEGQQTLEDAREQVEQAAGHFAQGARTLAADLDEEHARLTRDGFEALGQVVDEVERELAAARQESEQAWTQLEGAIRGFEGESQTSWDAADAACDLAATEAGTEASSLQAEGAAAVQALEAAGDELEGACTALDQELEAIYGGCVAGIDAEAEDLNEEAQKLAEEAKDFVEAATRDRLEAPVDLVEKEALEALESEYSTLQAALTAATAIAGVLEPLTEELAKSQTVIGQVDELMNAMTG